MLKAIRIMEDFITDFPESDVVDDARATIKDARERLARKRYESGRTYYKFGDYKAANIYFQAVIDENTNSDWAARALYYQSEIEYKDENYKVAKTKLDNFLVIYPDHDFSKKARKILAKIDSKFDESTQKE